MFGLGRNKKASNPYSSTHRTRTKRGRTRYYPKSSLRRKIKLGMKRKGYSKKARRKAAASCWY